MTPAWMIGTFGGVGHLRPAPGTWGALAALPLAWCAMELGGLIVFTLLLAVMFVAGVWAAQVVSQEGAHDPSEFVIDEVVGQWIALGPVLVGASMAGHPLLRLWPGWVAAFALFRLFDIWKPGPVGWADRRPDGLGVMLDDVIAGLLAALGVLVLAGLAHGLP